MQHLPDIIALVTDLVVWCITHRLKIAIAESCTGGIVASYITSIPGSSNVFGYGVVSYSEQAKVEILSVPKSLITTHGSVSAQVAEAMAIGILEKSGADYAVSITGFAGPDGGTLNAPIGTIYIGIASSTGAKSSRYYFNGSRTEVREQAAYTALIMLDEIVRERAI